MMLPDAVPMGTISLRSVMGTVQTWRRDVNSTQFIVDITVSIAQRHMESFLFPLVAAIGRSIDWNLVTVLPERMVLMVSRVVIVFNGWYFVVVLHVRGSMLLQMLFDVLQIVDLIFQHFDQHVDLHAGRSPTLLVFVYYVRAVHLTIVFDETFCADFPIRFVSLVGFDTISERRFQLLQRILDFLRIKRKGF